MLPEDGSPAPEELKPVELVRDILVTAKREIRETIWNLRIDELTQKRPKDVLMSLAQKLASTTAVRVEAILKGLPETLPEALFSDILYVVQESVTNAITTEHPSTRSTRSVRKRGTSGFPECGNARAEAASPSLLRPSGAQHP